jgi:5'(3')-deoxyribonucleotidase
MQQLLLDIDGVVVEYDFTGLVRRYFGVDVEPQSIFAYNLSDVLGVSSKEIDNMFYEQVWGNPIFIEDSIEVLNEIKQHYEIIVYSNRFKIMGMFELTKWLIDNKIPFDGVSCGDDKYSFHIDDRPEKLEDTNSSIKLLYTQPWNIKCHNIKNNLIRVNNWQEVRRKLINEW